MTEELQPVEEHEVDRMVDEGCPHDLTEVHPPEVLK